MISEEEYDSIMRSVSYKMSKAMSRPRGQTITIHDDICYWVMCETKDRFMKQLMNYIEKDND